MVQRLLIAGAIAVSMAAGVSGQSATLTVAVRTARPSADGRTVTVTLASGAQIEIAASDVVAGLSTPATPRGSALPSDADAGPQIRAKCAKEWPTDFSVRAYCETQQRTGLAALRARPMVAGDLATIRTACGKDWATDFSVWNYCEEQQIDALKKLQ